MTLAEMLKTRGTAKTVPQWKKAPVNYYESVKKGCLSHAFTESLLKDENKRFTRDLTGRYDEQYRQFEMYNALSVFSTFNSTEKRDMVYYSLYGLESDFIKDYNSQTTVSVDNAFTVFADVC